MDNLQKPHITAKTSQLAKQKKYCFIVNKKSNKSEIKKEAENQYGIKVIRVNTNLYKSKNITKNTKKGLIKGKKPAYKVATLTLSKESNIDIHGDITKN